MSIRFVAEGITTITLNKILKWFIVNVKNKSILFSMNFYLESSLSREMPARIVLLAPETAHGESVPSVQHGMVISELRA